MARYPSYENLEIRVKSFTPSFPISGITSKEYAQAGFYSIGVQDYTRCFYCGVGLRGWDNTDDPWKQHAKFSSNCKYLLEKKSKSFVELQQSNSFKLEDSRLPKGKIDNNESSQMKKLTDKEIDLHVKARMETEEIKLLLKYEKKIGFDKESLKKAIQLQLTTMHNDFQSTQEMLNQAISIFKEKFSNEH